MDFLIHHMLRTSARRSPDHEALVHGDQRLSYRDVDRRISGLAEGLREAGTLRGDRVARSLAASAQSRKLPSVTTVSRARSPSSTT